EGVDEARALYEWNHAKQILRIQAGQGEGWDSTRDDVFSEEFLLSRPLLTAIRRREPTVLLVDEVDKADIEIEGLLLEVLSDFAVTIPELGTIEATPLPSPGFPDPRARAQDPRLPGPRARRPAGRAAGAGGRCAPCDGAQEGTQRVRDHRLGAHPRRARAGHDRRRDRGADPRGGPQAPIRPVAGRGRAAAQLEEA